MIDCTGSLFEDTCSFSCDDGYELTGSENRTCQSDQTWSGTEPMCLQGVFRVINYNMYTTQQRYSINSL